MDLGRPFVHDVLHKSLLALGAVEDGVTPDSFLEPRENGYVQEAEDQEAQPRPEEVPEEVLQRVISGKVIIVAVIIVIVIVIVTSSQTAHFAHEAAIQAPVRCCREGGRKLEVEHGKRGREVREGARRSGEL